MADVTVKVLVPATSYALVSLDEAKVYLGISPADTAGDAQLQMLIDMNSDVISEICNRVFAKEKVRETWRCVGAICCPDGATRIFLTRWPVLEADIESVETPSGYPLLSSEYEIEEASGKLTIWTPSVSEIVIVYSGGYDLPDDSPNPLKQAAGLLCRSSRTEAASEATSGVRMIAHKDSRVMFHPPAKASSTGTSTGGSAAQQQVKGLLQNYQRIWV
jgi:hypothetical protein